MLYQNSNESKEASIATLKRSLGVLTRRQKIALGGMALANGVVLALAILVLRNSAGAVTPLYPPGPSLHELCGDVAARLLAQDNIAGSASIGSDNVLRLYLTGLDASGHPLSQATDVAWDAMAAVVTMPSIGCGPYPFVQVDVPAPEGETPASRLLVSVDWIDLRAWGYGELDDGALADRAQTTLYTQPSTTSDEEGQRAHD
jgi:hypothetical protein